MAAGGNSISWTISKLKRCSIKTFRPLSDQRRHDAAPPRTERHTAPRLQMFITINTTLELKPELQAPADALANACVALHGEVKTQRQ